MQYQPIEARPKKIAERTPSPKIPTVMKRDVIQFSRNHVMYLTHLCFYAVRKARIVFVNGALQILAGYGHDNYQ